MDVEVRVGLSHGHLTDPFPSIEVDRLSSTSENIVWLWETSLSLT